MRSSGSRQLATGSQRWSAVAETVGIWSHLNRQFPYEPCSPPALPQRWVADFPGFSGRTYWVARRRDGRKSLSKVQFSPDLV